MQDRFRADVTSNRHNRAILERWPTLALPDGWLVAGCLFQTVWNLQAGRAPEENIKDYDLFYFDGDDLSEAGEQVVQQRVAHLLADLGVKIEVANQARVHTWYEAYFGHPCAPLRGVQDGIDRFLIPATCIGIRPDALYAPNGLALMYQGVLSSNPLTPHADLFQQKAASYRERWPRLTIV
ncbi:hypothetical protein ASF61_03650 [Duganella sp. Leaf126]|uniref:nucleotidyltransferase family protein n=1 Tax=Duganella sp. Leaf126 TaxID=1736266 RepID=UPI0006FB9CC2|nr:nucleotidyltransferase family protein [Duganella sp. Leaf126]KQQ39920.1 hypothetical protein ASF61_03650 [Duganella sp. Leaf126]